jgi:multidrug efflux pump subunit AcrA (membrane-fusion protein)
METAESVVDSGTALLIVDVQNDSLPGGNLAVAGGETIIPVLNRYLQIAKRCRILVYASRDNILHATDQTGIVVITQLQPITVHFSIPQDNLPLVLKRLKSKERIPVDAYNRDEKNRLATGHLISLDNEIDTTTGTVRLKAEFANDDNVLFPEQFVNARMLVDTRRDVTTIPSAAIQRGMQGVFVFVVKGDRTVLRPVKTGPSEGGVTAVESGVQPGELVVVDGADRLREGTRVELPGDHSRADKGGMPSKKGSGLARAAYGELNALDV